MTIVSKVSSINCTDSYPKDCQNARDLFVSNGSLFIANDCGVLKMDLNSNSHVFLVSNKTCSCTEVHGIAPFGDNGDIVFTDVGSQQVKIASSDGHVEIIAGTGERGNSDGSRASFSQPTGICVENNKTILVTDTHVGAIKLITEINAVNLFLETLEKLYEAFSVNLKHKQVSTSSLPEAAEKVNCLDVFLKGTVSSVQALTGTTRKTNGPEGTVASKTTDSVAMIHHGLHKISLNIEKLNPKAQVNPESLLTLKAENLKHPTCLPLQYAGDFGSHMLESHKRMARWSAYYFTQPSSYYPVPSSQIDWKDLPRMEPLKSLLMSPEDKELMRKWARDHGKCVRQRTVRQETTKYKAGTLPDTLTFFSL